jgi:hypothetical protein
MAILKPVRQPESDADDFMPIERCLDDLRRVTGEMLRSDLEWLIKFASGQIKHNGYHKAHVRGLWIEYCWTRSRQTRGQENLSDLLFGEPDRS